MKQPACERSFTIRLSKAIKMSGRSLASVADVAGMGSRQAVYAYMKGRTQVERTLLTVQKLAAELGVEPGWLAGWQDTGGPHQGSRSLLKDDEWEKAVQALVRYVARQSIDASAYPDPKVLRLQYLRSDRAAKSKAYSVLSPQKNRKRVARTTPLRERSYREGSVIVLANAAGPVAMIRVSKYGIWSTNRMRVIPEKRS